jgi:hypothetical protein
MRLDERNQRRNGEQTVDGRKLGKWIHDFTRTGQKRDSFILKHSSGAACGDFPAIAAPDARHSNFFCPAGGKYL